MDVHRVILKNMKIIKKLKKEDQAIMKFLKATILTVMLIFVGQQVSYSQIVAPTGISTRASSQLVYYYDQASSDSVIQVANTNDTTSVWVHVQIFRSFNAGDSTTPNIVLCDERDFVDFLTPNDTHVYSLDFSNFPKNVGETEADPGESTSIDSTGTKGFVIITPVVSEVDFTGISFQYLIGSTFDDSHSFAINAMGRDAVDYATGDIAEVGTPLDGTSNGYVLLQPEELVFSFANEEATVDVVGIAFADNYGPAGLLGYQVTPADATWTSFIFDFKEDPTSCGIRPVGCFLTLGLNETFNQHDTELSNGNDLLCSGAETPEYDPMDNANFNTSYAYMGWTRIFVSGVSDFENHLGLFYDTQVRDARWMYTE